MSGQNKQMVRSILASVVGIAGSILVVAGVVETSGAVNLPSWWVQGLLIVTMVSTAARTLIAYIDPQNTSFGRGSA